MSKAKAKANLKITVKVISGVVVTNISKDSVLPKTYSEVIDALKVAQQIYEEKRIIHGDAL